jgi:hypothetical protein
MGLAALALPSAAQAVPTIATVPVEISGTVCTVRTSGLCIIPGVGGPETITMRFVTTCRNVCVFGPFFGSATICVPFGSSQESYAFEECLPTGCICTGCAPLHIGCCYWTRLSSICASTGGCNCVCSPGGAFFSVCCPPPSVCQADGATFTFFSSDPVSGTGTISVALARAPEVNATAATVPLAALLGSLAILADRRRR